MGCDDLARPHRGAALVGEADAVDAGAVEREALLEQAAADLRLADGAVLAVLALGERDLHLAARRVLAEPDPQLVARPAVVEEERRAQEVERRLHVEDDRRRPRAEELARGPRRADRPRHDHVAAGIGQRQADEPARRVHEALLRGSGDAAVGADGAAQRVADLGPRVRVLADREVLRAGPVVVRRAREQPAGGPGERDAGVDRELVRGGQLPGRALGVRVRRDRHRVGAVALVVDGQGARDAEARAGRRRVRHRPGGGDVVVLLGRHGRDGERRVDVAQREVRARRERHRHPVVTRQRHRRGVGRGGRHRGRRERGDEGRHGPIPRPHSSLQRVVRSLAVAHHGASPAELPWAIGLNFATGPSLRRGRDRRARRVPARSSPAARTGSCRRRRARSGGRRG